MVTKSLVFTTEYFPANHAKVSSSERFKIGRITCACEVDRVQLQLQRARNAQRAVSKSVCSVEWNSRRFEKIEREADDRRINARTRCRCLVRLWWMELCSSRIIDRKRRIRTTALRPAASPTTNPAFQFYFKWVNATTNLPSEIKINLLLSPQEIMDVEHLWKYSESEFGRQNENNSASQANNNGAGTSSSSTSAIASNPLLASAGLGSGEDSNPDLIANLCSVADHRLYKIVKWCKSLPLFKNISVSSNSKREGYRTIRKITNFVFHFQIDDQICLLINSWCELLLFSCCFRSISTPGEVRISLGKSINLEQAKLNGLQVNLKWYISSLLVDWFKYFDFIEFSGVHWTNAQFDGSFETAESRQIRICCNESDCSATIG